MRHITVSEQTEERVLHTTGHMVASAMGVGSIAAALSGPGGAVLGALLGLAAGFLLPRVNPPR